MYHCTTGLYIAIWYIVLQKSWIDFFYYSTDKNIYYLRNVDEIIVLAGWIGVCMQFTALLIIHIRILAVTLPI